MAKYYQETSENFSIVDNNTGEVFPYNQIKKFETNEFIMVFLTNCSPLMELTGNHLKVLICCWEYATYNPAKEQQGNIIYNGPGFKKACKEIGLDVSGATIDNAISTLCKRGLLLKMHRGEYMLNPQYFYKGRLSARNNIKLPESIRQEEQVK